jgi:uncharacterized 2Fe-2S/4Fe-4S cluster protein (DUF4445 family)
MSSQHRLKAGELGLGPDWRLACFSSCTGDITLEAEQFNHIILADESEFEFEPQEGYGVAVDLGTTTVVAQLISLKDGKVLEAETMLNPQQRFGADLISRIQACIDGHAPEMTKIIRNSIGTMISLMLKKHPVKIRKAVLVGNTAMQQLFNGSDVTPLATYPFQPSDTRERILTAKELSWNFPVVEEVVFFPSIGGFVGSDILAGLAATGLYKKEDPHGLIDLGTNGEISVGNRHGIICASTAAGPAFEGSNISAGMRAVTGAISSFRMEGDHLAATVIGNGAARGICGSALIDAIALLREIGAIGSYGEILSGDASIPLTGKISLTQKDIHEFLLAKAALATGFSILTNRLLLGPEDIREFFIAGGFGNYIHVPHLTETGAIGLPVEKIRKMGNTALIGAKMFLFSGLPLAEEILKITNHISLESDPGFQDIFISHMFLE